MNHDSNELKLKKHSPAKLETAEPSTSAAVQVIVDPEQRETDLNILRTFDLTSEFGPCVGLTRMARWRRAADSDGNPPRNVKQILEKNADDQEYEQNVWYKYNF